ncbi:MAG: ATP synthase F1 subunit delta [Lachnospiraceae bacterium]|nr:ATP synthase F1 subunit delta [Lachnospiraceae bacterium]
MAKLVSTTYGEALYELAVEENKVDVFQEEIQEVRKVLLENKDFAKLMNHPHILKEEKIKVIENVFKGRISDELTGFFILTVEKDRYSNMNGILDYFIEKVKALKGIGISHVTSAVPLTDSQKKEIEEKLLETTSYKTMEMHYKEDPSIIGGLVIHIGDRVVDSSIQSKLASLEKQLLKIQL